jgi:hypothetical protein
MGIKAVGGREHWQPESVIVIKHGLRVQAIVDLACASVYT